MLKNAQENVWKEKARELKLQNEQEIQARKLQEENEAGWKRRVQESDWILKGVSKVKDNQVENVIHDGLERKENAVYQHIRIKLKSSGNAVKEQTADIKDVEKKSFRDTVVDLLKTSIAKKKKKIGEKQRLAEIKRREIEAEQRGAVLVKTSYRIRMLQQVYQLLNVGRMPAHNKRMSTMEGFTEDVEYKQYEDILRERELRDHYDGMDGCYDCDICCL